MFDIFTQKGACMMFMSENMQLRGDAPGVLRYRLHSCGATGTARARLSPLYRVDLVADFSLRCFRRGILSASYEGEVNLSGKL